MFSRRIFIIHLVSLQAMLLSKFLPTSGTLVRLLGRVDENVTLQSTLHLKFFSAKGAQESNRVLDMFNFYMSRNTTFA